MSDKFQINPFSILDTRSKDWQQRKRWWINKYNIQSELGREDTNSGVSLWNDNSVSVFDATLCEVIYDWFLPETKGSILDPFAGGSVRGIVATELGHEYTGIDLSHTQIQANKQQSDKPKWLHGDSDQVLHGIEDEYDLVFTCPPYHDLEIYTDHEDDLSNMDYNRFIDKYRSILLTSTEKLKENRFLVIVVSEIREQSITRDYKIGKYKGFISDTIKAVEDCGLHFYNDIILYNSTLNASRVSKTYFERNRKVASVHQNVLVFVKGNPDLAVEEFKTTEPVCNINGVDFKSLRHAAISIDADVLVASEVERRCKSLKFKYKDWNIVGVKKKPLIKIDIDGLLFESIIHATQVLNYNERDIKSRVTSRNPEWNHWRVLDSISNLSYDEVKDTWTKIPRLELDTIQCGSKSYVSAKHAAQDLNLTPARINQKIRSDKHEDFFKLF